MTRFRSVPAVALAAGLVLAAGSPAQPPLPGTPAKPPVPAPELPVVPKSAAAFVSLKVSDLLDHPDLKPALDQLKKTPEALEGVTEVFGVDPHEVDRVTLFWPAVSPRGPGDPVVVVTTREPYNEARVLKALKAAPVFGGDGPGRHRFPAQNVKPGGGHFHEPPAVKSQPVRPDRIPVPEKPPSPPPGKDGGGDGSTVPVSAALPGEPLYYELDHNPFDILFLADDRTLVFLPDRLSEAGVLPLLAQLLQRKPAGPLADAITAAGTHTLAAGLYLPPMFRGLERRAPPELAPYAALAAAKVGTLTGDLGKTAKMTLTLTFEDAAAARRAAPVLEEGLKAVAEDAAGKAARMKDGRGPEAALAPLIEAAAAGMKKAAVKADGAAVVATAEVDAGPAVAKAAADFAGAAADRKRFALRSNHLKQVGLALHTYHDAHGRFPANVYGPNGEPLLSWRVQLLPYLEQDDLYKQFKMDEAWDGPNNKKLLDKMPRVFETEGRDAPKGHTFYQAFVSPDPRKPPAAKGRVGQSWLREGVRNNTTFAGVTDGLSNTIGVVEARTAAAWSKPDDLPLGEKLPPLGDERADRFMALFLDGSVRPIPADIKPEVLRLLIDIADGMVIPDYDERPRGFPLNPGGSGSPVKK